MGWDFELFLKELLKLGILKDEKEIGYFLSPQANPYLTLATRIFDHYNPNPNVIEHDKKLAEHFDKYLAGIKD